MTYVFCLSDILPKKELHSSLWVVVLFAFTGCHVVEPLLVVALLFSTYGQAITGLTAGANPELPKVLT